jgi:hypothetical protein
MMFHKCMSGKKLGRESVSIREYLKIYRGLGLFAVVRVGSTPTPSSLSPVSKNYMYDHKKAGLL